MVSRTVIGQAEGILMERYGLGADQAFAYLRRASQAQHRKLVDIAVELVATRQLPANSETTSRPAPKGEGKVLMADAAPSPAFEHTSYGTTDPDQGHQFIREAYTDVDVTICGSDDDFHFSSDVVRIGTTLISRMRHSMAVSMDVHDGVAWQAIMQTHQPSLAFDTGHDRYRLGGGDAVVVEPDTPYAASWDTLDIDLVNLDLAKAADLAAAQLGPDEEFGFDFDTAVSPLAAQLWGRTVSLVRRLGLANAANPDGALLADQLNGLLASTALVCFPNPTLREHQAESTRTTTPASLRRAVAYIEAHADQPISLQAVAGAARVTPRALSLTFNRHLNTSPMGYARRTRLERAHQDLQQAHPGDGQTVTSIAHRWGFHNLPRFSATYRATYGQVPSRTLRNNH